MLFDTNNNIGGSSSKYKNLNPLMAGGIGGKICKPLRGQIKAKNEKSNNIVIPKK